MDTVKALFVRSFPKQLTLEYLDAMNTKIYIHDNGKDMFYELEDLRWLRAIKPHLKISLRTRTEGWEWNALGLETGSIYEIRD